jgi:predicted dehydrogenase
MSAAKKIRYAVVGLGDLAQRAMLPAIEHTGDSKLTARVTGDREKALQLGYAYSAPTFGYDQFGEGLRSGDVDAIYLAIPNWQHAEFVIPALKAGIHVLVEKPLEVSSARRRKIFEAQRSKVKLMVAYRLHSEPATLALIQAVRSGELGEVHLFSSTFAQRVVPQNHRARSGDRAGPLLDMGPYPVNAARSVFGAEPIRVLSATATRHPDGNVGGIVDTVAATLEFSRGRLAHLIVSYYGSGTSSLHVAGTRGSIVMHPAYTYGEPIERWWTLGKQTDHQKFRMTDQFGGELKYFSDCILQPRDPEPDAREGLADVETLEAMQHAIELNRAVNVAPVPTPTRLRPEQVEQLPLVKPHVAEVHARSPIRES